MDAAPLLINNGLAPPSPTNVIDGALGAFGNQDPVVAVRNQGCADPSAPCASPGDATTAEIASGAVVWGVVDVRDTSALEMTGGHVWGEVVLHDSAQLSVSDHPYTLGTHLIANDSSHVLVSGGEPGGLRLNDAATGIVTGGGFSLGVSTHGSSSLVYSGGYGDSLSATDQSSILMTGGSANYLSVSGDATIVMTGGTIVDAIHIDGNGTLRIESDASLGALTEMGAAGSTVIRIAGHDFTVNGVAVGYGVVSDQAGAISGTLLSGDTFTIDQFFHDGYFDGSQTWSGQIVLVPEPETGLLVAGGLLALGARRRRYARTARRSTNVR